MIAGVILPEIAKRYGRALKTVTWWRWRYEWPEPTGKRGRWDEYDPDQVDQAVALILREPAEEADPDELLDAKGAAAEAGIAYGTVRADISRERWPAPDADEFGVKRWKRRTVRDEMASRRPNRRRRPGGTPGAADTTGGPVSGEGRETAVACLLLFGDDAELALEGAEDAGSTVRWPAAVIAAETGLELDELPGRRFLVRVTEDGEGQRFAGFRLAG